MTPCMLSLVLFFFPYPACLVTGAAGPEASVAAYGRSNPQCAEWTDGCVVCTGAGGRAQCSTPGIACTPGAPACKRPVN